LARRYRVDQNKSHISSYQLYGSELDFAISIHSMYEGTVLNPPYRFKRSFMAPN